MTRACYFLPVRLCTDFVCLHMVPGCFLRQPPSVSYWVWLEGTWNTSVVKVRETCRR